MACSSPSKSAVMLLPTPSVQRYLIKCIVVVNISRPAAVLADLAILALTAIKTYQEWFSSNVGDHKASLASVLFIDGEILVKSRSINVH